MPAGFCQHSVTCMIELAAQPASAGIERQHMRVQIAVLRAMLTIVSATAIQVHYVVLLLIIRACYNIYIMSRSDTTQQTAKAVLIQIANIVFHRLLVGHVVAVQPIAMPDLASSAPRVEQRRETMVAQGVVHSVWQAMTQAEGDALSPSRAVFVANGEADARCACLLVLAAARVADGALLIAPAPCRSELSSSRADGEADSTLTEPPAPATPLTNGEQPRAATPPTSEATRALHPQLTSTTGAAVSADAGSDEAAHDRLLECGHKVIRALCKLAMLTSTVPGDTSVTYGRALAMELLAGVLVNHGAHFSKFPKLMAVVKSDLGNCLLANSKSSSPVLQQLTCQIFVIVLKTFREELKTKVCCELCQPRLACYVAPVLGTLAQQARQMRAASPCRLRTCSGTPFFAAWSQQGGRSR